MNLLTLSMEQAKTLEQHFTIEEVCAVVWSCASHKASGLDGISFYFYKKAWVTIKEDIFCKVDTFFKMGILPQSIKSSFTTLIPKNVQLFVLMFLGQYP